MATWRTVCGELRYQDEDDIASALQIGRSAVRDARSSNPVGKLAEKQVDWPDRGSQVALTAGEIAHDSEMKSPTVPG
ncbi:MULTISPECIES: hypothetical protein [unclassified Bradyrhizobium]